VQKKPLNCLKKTSPGFSLKSAIPAQKPIFFNQPALASGKTG
jgi:hypothetical protein